MPLMPASRYMIWECLRNPPGRRKFSLWIWTPPRPDFYDFDQPSFDFFVLKHFWRHTLKTTKFGKQLFEKKKKKLNSHKHIYFLFETCFETKMETIFLQKIKTIAFHFLFCFNKTKVFVFCFQKCFSLFLIIICVEGGLQDCSSFFCVAFLFSCLGPIIFVAGFISHQLDR